MANSKPNTPIIGIYKITSPTGRVYIGQSWDIKSRWKGYRTKHAKDQFLLYNSFRKYGVDRHKFEIIHGLSADDSQVTMDYWEQHYMNTHRAEGCSLLNLRGAGSHGKWSDEWKAKRSKAMKGRKMSKEAREAMSAAQKGRVQSAETRRRIGDAHKRRYALLPPPSPRTGKKTRVHLTALQVIQIRQRHIPFAKQGNKRLAEEFNVSVSTIERITGKGKGASWQYV